MHPARLAAYLEGGVAPGGARAHPGCRDPRPPRWSTALTLPGLLYFATESAVWTGGRAFYDPHAPGETAAHAHLITLGQLSDIAAQEMGRVPGVDLDLTAVLRSGRARLGPGRYETLVCAGTLEGHPVLTFTAPWRSVTVPWNAPAAAYLRHLGGGLRAAHGWGAARAGEYLASRPGARGHWTAHEVAALLNAA
ncbi:histone deacetylase [Streptomyces radicis]|uniref:Histone deacetylase n=1 Tax=Streptomyces radicis TaxID=1750517 RepID=A0A3A9W9Y7_9ACTN|nr:histone deacetylase [Streptomyces radicis]RKN10101.1 histone deacetylase [Streptomyces radicis]RKN24443.1 histone deacetylase [Streptomyces radicis]